MSPNETRPGVRNASDTSKPTTTLKPASTGFSLNAPVTAKVVKPRAKPFVLGRGRLLLGAGMLYIAASITTYAIIHHQIIDDVSAEAPVQSADVNEPEAQPHLQPEVTAKATVIDKPVAIDPELTAELETAKALVDQLEAELEDARISYETERARASSLQQATQTAEVWMQSALREKSDMTARLMSVENRLEGILDQRDDAERSHNAWRWRAEILEERLEMTEQDAMSAQRWFETWVDTQVASLSGIASQTGIDIDLVLNRARNVMVAGQGGPFELALGEGALDPSSSRPELATAIQDMMSLRHFLLSAPLATPFDHYSVTSGFGQRRDPVNRRLANHRGIDMVAPRNTKVMTTSPGTVIFAGRRGAFGNLVEVDHGLGITTRYAHLKSVLVQKGDKVAFRDEIGVIGSSGRSTGRHLHYEILIDGKQIDPTGFIVAGRHLVHVFQNR